ncbi:MAG: hypothetical protein LBU81_03960 [Methanosarcinales archaeon]|jgi:hypothetical protein|nr:hypothetical protein [Methanosarcinales archaeon]
MMTKLDSKNYDERQMIDRYKISFETMLLTFVLIFISGMINIFHGPWAAGNTQMMILLSIPTSYFAVRVVLKRAYFSVRQKSYAVSLILFGATGLLNLGNFVLDLMNGGSIIENGVLSEDLFSFFLALPFILIPAAYFILKQTDKNNAEDD